MKKTINLKPSKTKLKYIVLLISLFLFQLTSCHLKKKPINSTENKKGNKKATMALHFDILLKEVDTLNEMKYLDYVYYDLPASLRQTNVSKKIVELNDPRFIIYENFEIVNLKGQAVDSLINQYHYSIVFDPEDYFANRIELKPRESLVDTINLISDFNFYRSDPGTFLIRVKKEYSGEMVYSNWDTLIIR